MRKDLKIGMAIGAVLLAVLVVYFAMPKPEDGGGGDVAGAGETAAVATTDGAAVSGDPITPAAEATPSARARQDGAGADAAGSSVANAGKSKRDVFAPDADATTADEGDDADAAEGDGGGTNWAKLLEMGDSGDIVRTETPPTPTADAAKASGTTEAGTSTPRLAASRRENDNDDSIASSTPGGLSAGPAAGSTASASPGSDDDASSETTPGSTGSDATAGGGSTGSASAGGARTHKVKAGENYSTIAKAVYGHSRYYLAIEKANPDIDPTRIRPGTEIKLPDPATVKGSASSSTVAAGADDADAAPRAIDPNTEYRVKPNDNLHDIAVAKYGSSTMADKIYELNEQTIGSDPAKLKLGMILKLPPGAKKDETVASEQ